jgi:DNA-binding transcriptional regulator GbsR (MarR family)
MSELFNFDGPSYSPEQDQERLSDQFGRIRGLMMDGRWRSLSEISRELNYPESSVSAQLRHMRKSRFGGYVVERQRSEFIKGLFYYRVLPPATCSAPVKRTRASVRMRELVERVQALEAQVRSLGGEP